MVYNEVITNVEIDLTKAEVISIPKPQQSKTVTPTTETQSILPDDDKELAQVIVEGVTADIDQNIKPENIKLGTNILGVEGNVAPDKPDQEKIIYPTEEEQIVEADTGYELSRAVIKPIETESKTIVPSIETQVIKPTSGKYIKEVIVEAIEDIDSEIAEQEQLLNSLNQEVDNLKDISKETIIITESGEYDVSKYGIAIVTLGGQAVTLDLPDAFSTSLKLYYVWVTEDKALISSDSTESGIWIYTLSSNTITLLTSEYNKADVFMQLENNDWLISSTKGNIYGVIIYNSLTDNWSYFSAGSRPFSKHYKITDTKWWITPGSGSGSSSGGVIIYDTNTSTFTKIEGMKGYNWYPMKQISDTKYITSSLHYNKNIYVLDIESYEAVLIDNTIIINDPAYIVQIANNLYTLSGNYTASSGAGLILYNSDTGETTQLSNSGYYWKVVLVTQDKFITSNNSNSVLGLYEYSISSGQFKQIYELGYSWLRDYFDLQDGRVLLGGAASASQGLLIYNKQDSSCTPITEEGYNYCYFYRVNEIKILINNSGDSATRGVHLLNLETMKLSKLGATNSHAVFTRVSDIKILISGITNSNPGIYLYKSDDDSLRQIYGANYSYGLIEQITNNKWILLTNFGTQKAILYKADDDSVIDLVKDSQGYFDTLTPDAQKNYYISGSDKTITPSTWYYTEATDSAKLVSYYLEAKE